ncbi:methyl-accepting chemotaxis protein [Thaumasiovibrio subtropicus]|uniref:methyl-accepting chemotaxis protein n=1 Tax=Thaumasiovibrio subtropicus TaxID=1891207 RepID=UPI000B3531AB|nr:methyl-accepting chemotaxis protein [Thaumasiovibrio subtropicus]
MFFRNLAVRKKLTITFALIAVINLVFAFFSFGGLKKIHDELINYSDDTLPAVMSVVSLQNQFATLRLSQYKLLKNFDSHSELIDEISQNDRQKVALTQALNTYGRTVWPGEEQETFNRLMADWGTYLQLSEKYQSLLMTHSKTEAQRLVVNNQETADSMNVSFTTLIRILNEAMQGNRNSIIGEISDLETKTWVSNTFMLFIMLAATILLTKAICGPLNLVVGLANRIAHGDLSSTIDTDKLGKDELGRLASAVDTMQSNLKQLIEHIANAVTQLNSSINQVSAVSRQSAQDMHSQQNETHQVSVAMTEMDAVISDISKNTENAAQGTHSAMTLVDSGNQQVASMVTAMEEVAQYNRRSDETVAELEKRSQQIHVFVDVIQDIAEQTNLLALNAAIEAARAGESGRGFAVVASEVRSLAGRTQESTGEISTIIEAFRASTQSVKAVSIDSQRSTERCLEVGQQVQQTMAAVQTAVTDISDMGTQIASACSQQSSVVSSLTTQVENMQHSSQQVASGAQTTANACTELDMLAESLQQSVNKFRLK